MGRFPSTATPRPRSHRARRRVFFCAESLETRQLLSVAAYHPAIAPVGNVPAAVGPVVASPVTNAGTAGSAAGSAAGLQIVLEFNPVSIGQSGFQGFTETILFIEPPVSSGIGATGPIASGNLPSPTTTGDTSPTTTSSETSPAPAIAPLTPTILAGPSGSRSAVAVVIVPQTPPINLQPSTIPVTTQAILATALLEEQPIPPPFLGQGFESGQTQGGDPLAENGLNLPKVPVPLEPQIPPIDFVEPFRPAPVNPPAAQPGQPAERPARGSRAGVTPSPSKPRPSSPPPSSTRPGRPSSRSSRRNPRARPRRGRRAGALAAIVGTASIAGGGYHLVLGGSNRRSQRWLPARDSSKRNRERKPTTV